MIEYRKERIGETGQVRVSLKWGKNKALPDKTALEKLHEIEKSARIYNIHWCNAGIGIQFYEPPPGYTDYPGNGEWRKYLITRKYYPTFEEVVCGEYSRLFPGRKG